MKLKQSRKRKVNFSQQITGDDGEADYEEDADEAELYDRYINDAVCYEIYQIKTNIAETVDELDSIARDKDPKFFIEKYCDPQPVAKDI